MAKVYIVGGLVCDEDGDTHLCIDEFLQVFDTFKEAMDFITSTMSDEWEVDEKDIKVRKGKIGNIECSIIYEKANPSTEGDLDWGVIIEKIIDGEL